MVHNRFGGVDLDDTPTSNKSGHPLGTVVNAANNQQYIHVGAIAAISQYDAVAVSEDGSARPLTSALALVGHRIGFAQQAFASGDNGWVALKGSDIKVTLAADCAADTALYISGAAGVLDDSGTAAVQIRGVVAVVAATSVATAREIIATWPMVNTP